MRRLVVTLGVERWRQRGTALAEVLQKNADVVSWWVGEGVYVLALPRLAGIRGFGHA